MSATRPNTAILTDLEAIRSDALSRANPYALDAEATKNLGIVLDTLVYLVKYIDDPKTFLKQTNRPFYNTPAVIRFDLAPLNDYTGAERKYILFTNYIELFIECFRNVQDVGPDNVNIFCSRLYGSCLDTRTRKAFDYAMKFGYKAPPVWSARLEDARRMLENTAFVDTTFKLLDKNLKEMKDDSEIKGETDEARYHRYFADADTADKLIQTVVRFFYDDFHITNDNRDLVLCTVEQLCISNPAAASNILHRNIHKNNKDLIINRMIENNLNLNVESIVDDVHFNTLHRAILAGASKKRIEDLLDRGARIIPGMENDVLAIATKRCTPSALAALVVAFPDAAQALSYQIDYTPIAILLKTTDGPDAVYCNDAKLALTKALYAAEKQGRQFAYTDTEKKVYTDFLIEQMRGFTRLEQCYQFFAEYYNKQILNYERHYDLGHLLLRRPKKLTGSMERFITALQAKIYSLVSTLGPVALLYQTQHDSPLSKMLFSSLYYNIEPMTSYYKERIGNLLLLNRGALNPRNASLELDNIMVVHQLAKANILNQVFDYIKKYIHAYVSPTDFNPLYTDEYLAKVFNTLQASNIYHPEYLAQMQLEINYLRDPKTAPKPAPKAPPAPPKVAPPNTANPTQTGKPAQNKTSQPASNSLFGFTGWDEKHTPDAKIQKYDYKMDENYDKGDRTKKIAPPPAPVVKTAPQRPSTQPAKTAASNTATQSNTISNSNLSTSNNAPANLPSFFSNVAAGTRSLSYAIGQPIPTSNINAAPFALQRTPNEEKHREVDFFAEIDPFLAERTAANPKSPGK